MKRRALPRAGFDVPELSLGTMNFGSNMAGAAVEEEQARAIVARALEAGCDLLDTADVYGRGASEEMLGRILAGRRSRVLIATKVLGAMEDGDPGGLAPSRIERRLDDSLRRLRMDHVDLYMPHAPDPRVPLEATLEALARALRKGKIRAWGLSNFPPAGVRAAVAAGLPGGPAFNQVQFSLAFRREAPAMGLLARETEVPILAWSPLGGGLFSGKYLESSARGRRRCGGTPFPELDERALRTEVECVVRRAEAAGLSPARLALSWVLAHPWVASAVCGVRTSEQFDELLGLPVRPSGRKAVRRGR